MLEQTWKILRAALAGVVIACILALAIVAAPALGASGLAMHATSSAQRIAGTSPDHPCPPIVLPC